MPTNPTKSEALRVRLTEEEATAFKAYADSVGETRTTLLRQYVRERVNCPWPDLLDNEQSALRVAIRHLAGISRNLNQITAAIHSGKAKGNFNDSYLAEVKRYVDEVKREFAHYLTVTRERLVNFGQENPDEHC